MAEEKLTSQTAFNKIANHLIEQGCPALDDCKCKYRLTLLEGKILKCAIGCLIPDNLYHPDMEGKRVGTLFGTYPKLKELLNQVKYQLLFDLQDVHDSGIPENWKKQLIVTAGRYKLEIPKSLKAE